MSESMDDIMHPGSGFSGDSDFPHAPVDWTRSRADHAAKAESIEMTEDHWEVVRALQSYFSRQGGNDINLRDLHDALGETFHARGGIKYLYQILPGGPVTQGCRIAGLVPPTGASDKGFGSVA